ncbi:MAG: Gldg family protein, partial [Patescibacteria group bacterium]|nr:Gldg family protein [Patescibacteria group bacterium]
MNMNVLLSVFKRDFVSYFTSPLGYVFVWLFVFLGTIAAFWPNEFFNANLANLNQLNYWFPFIMLAFIPAITMSIWAEERRQGTDELLLTIPVADFDVVLGKYSAAVAIYTVSLLFSLLCNYLVLETLGDPDVGLLAGTYCGYWFVGLAMLAVGMVGSFMTRNLTVAFILGALFNAPLVLAIWADSIMSPTLGAAAQPWSVGQQFADFGSGVISLSSIAYFATILAVMLYACMVMIGRRHWARGADWVVQAVHYTVRAAALVAVAGSVVLLAEWHDARLDVTSEQINSLSPQTVSLIRSLEAEQPVQIEAFISPRVPEAYVQTKANLESVLREFRGLAGAKVRVRIHSVEPYSEEASHAEKLYSITPRPVPDVSRGAVTTERIFLGVAVTHGLQRVVLPFIDRGIPVEYELARSVATVTDQKRKKIGVINTDAPLFGQFNMQAMTPGQDWPIVAELQKQYEVVRIDPSQPITEEVDALLAVQPSSLDPAAMDHFIAAVESGIPTAIFEDPFPVLAGNVPATSMPRSAPQMNPMMGMMGQQQAPPKGDMGRLWRLLGVDFAADQIVWQNYNPYRKARTFPNEFVFVDQGADVDQPFNPESRITSDLQQVLFPFPGALAKLQSSDLEFTPLARTGNKTGNVRFRDLVNMGMFGQPAGLNENPRRLPTGTNYVLAARIRGKVKPADHMADDSPAAKPPAAMPAAETPAAETPAAEAPAAEAPAAEAPATDMPAAEAPAAETAATDMPAAEAPAAEA